MGRNWMPVGLTALVVTNTRMQVMSQQLVNEKFQNVPNSRLQPTTPHLDALGGFNSKTAFWMLYGETVKVQPGVFVGQLYTTHRSVLSDYTQDLQMLPSKDMTIR